MGCSEMQVYQDMLIASAHENLTMAQDARFPKSPPNRGAFIPSSFFSLRIVIVNDC